MTTNDPRPLSKKTRTTRTTLLAFVLFVGGIACGVWWSTPIRERLGLGGLAAASGEAPTGVKQLWTCGMHPQVIQDRPGTCPICGMTLVPVGSTGIPQAAGGERKVKYWWDPMMNPPYIAGQPGKSPMGMDLVPVYEDEVAAGSTLTIDPAVVQNMGVRLAEVQETGLARTVRAVGVLAEPEPARHDVNLRLGGWIDRLYAATEGMHLASGDPLFDLYSPDLQVAVEELIGARKMRAVLPEGQAETVFAAAVRKLELYGLTRAQADELAGLDAAPRAVTFRSPANGYLVEKMVYAGSAVMEGDTVMRIADTSKLWLDARVFEKDLPHVQVGQSVTANVDGRPGETFRGEVILVKPRIDPMTRTATVRLEIDNPELSLRQGMFATAFLELEVAPDAVVVPREAIIDTGTRQVAFVALDGGHFEPRKVEMGASGDDGLVQVLSGLVPGELVVTSGQFLLDAESRMKEAIQRFLQEKAKPGTGPAGEEPASLLTDVSDDWRRSTEGALAAYLDLTRKLGKPQEGSEPVDAGQLVDAARSLRDRAAGEDASKLAEALGRTAAALQGRPIDEQRKLFAAVSDAAIRLAERSPRTGELAPHLFVFRCPMVRGLWLQDGETVANPYYATTMKGCGEVVRRLTVPGNEPEHADPGHAHGGSHR